MTGRLKRSPSAPRRASVAAAGAVLLALAGGLLSSAPASADAVPSTTAAATPTAPGRTATEDAAFSRASAPSLARVTVLRSSNTVYPVEDGYQDSVRFAVRATDGSGRSIPVIGTAVLTMAGTTVSTWYLDGTVARITWNGRIGRAIRTGLYALTVTEWSPDGVTRTGRTMVRVLAEHLVRHEYVTFTRVDRHRVVALMPDHLLDAFSKGLVKVRIETVAAVHGPAKLIYTNDGITETLRLRNGTHITPELPVPQGFNRVTVTHAWARGAAHLKRLKTIWIHYDLH